MKEAFTLQVNGEKHTVQADPAMPLLYVLRNQLALNGPKYGCGLEQCGACMVLLDGKANPSCRIPVSTVASKSVITLEGLIHQDGALHPVQKAFVEQQAAQCGYCLNGMVMTAVALLEEQPHPDDTAIREGMQRVLCRCCVHARVVRAIQSASKAMATQNE